MDRKLLCWNIFPIRNIFVILLYIFVIWYYFCETLSVRKMFNILLQNEKCDGNDMHKRGVATPILLIFRYVVEGRILSDMHFVRSVGRSLFKSYEGLKFPYIHMYVI